MAMTIYENSLHEVYVNDLTDIIYLSPSTLDGAAMDSNWSCKQRVVDTDEVEVISEVAVTEKSGDNSEFKVYLTGAQTGTLTAGDYTWYIQIRNDVLSPPFIKEIHLILRVSDEGILS